MNQVLELTCTKAIQKPHFDDTPTPEFHNPSWMAAIPNNRSLSEITLPGTHNTMALFGGVLAQCQSWSLALQLEAGVRLIDVRVRNVTGNLTIHHGMAYQRAHFGDVLQVVSSFLRRQPTEAVLMRLREEFSETDDIYGAVVSYIQSYANWDLLWQSRLVPTMGQVRGKLIVLQDFHGPDLGMRYRSLDIDDKWKVETRRGWVPTLLHVPEKWQSVQKHLEAAEVGNKDRLFLSYASGAGLFAFPSFVAQRVNVQLLEYLTVRMGKPRRFGMISMDFPAAPLLQAIIDFN
ncbi:hypothetical protein Z043_115785 [Scleropages formosus]|uniref:Phosphatidylinositol-specific phospholipase C X domain-containing protein n=1 Tax=Scleropages formosus TaxID=113540 RepID=A0A0P7U732_SCLFO|nr:hypothetical protein Z043_115785 [Scleropages formosus]